ncbi:MAG: ATPase, T2SS/T4P/T4SS family, partial [Desulfobacterales bacterium]
MKKPEIDHILSRMLDAYDNVSDLNITVGKPFQVETAGELAAVDMNPPFDEITPFQAEIFALNLLNQNRRLTENLLLEGSCDSSYELPGKARFRVNVFSQRGNYSIVLRKLATKIPTCEELGIPESFLKMAEEKNGFILVTGATGTGKTTSLAAVLNEINNIRSVHVVTLEDPVEYDHPQKMATFNQREMGED